MKVYYNIQTFVGVKNPITTIGTFDGVHLGHQKIIRRLMEIKKEQGGETAIFTFDPHPRAILFPEKEDLKLITTTSEKISLLEKAGIDHLIVFPFTHDFSQISADTYIRDVLIRQLKIKTLVIGYDHRFGSNREGNIETLVKYGKELNFEVEEIPAQDIDNIIISSTKIRKALEEGDVKTANSGLGYTYFFEGLVVKGKQLGRTIGYPTANIGIKDPLKLIPKIGVYAVVVYVEGITYKGMLSIGMNPTTDSDGIVKLEVNIFDFDKDIYGNSIKVGLIERLRDEEKFSTLEELKLQLALDKKNSLEIFSTLH